MERVLVIGSSAAGKTVFSRRLAAITGLKLVHLDQLYWRAGWTEPAPAAWRAAVAAAIAESSWIIDGNYAGTLSARAARADTVILFDLPSWLCLWQALRRVAGNVGRARAEMNQDCPERIDGAFFKYVWRFRRDQFPRTLAALQRFNGVLIVHRSRAAAEAHIAELAARHAAR